jgi:transposase InsO family protein/transposase-like protein
VKLFIKLGKRVGLTIRQLGYPTKNALKAWCREYEQRLDLSAGYARQPRYSSADKDRAVQHHRDHGQCIAATIKALGYPSRSLLSAWIQELNPQARAPAVERSPELPPEAKQAAVIAFCLRSASAQTVADDVGVSRGTLYKWKNQLLDHDPTVPMKCHHDVPASADRAELEEQIEALRRDVRRLQLEKDLLKKANELLKREPGIGQQPLTNREKTQLVDALRQDYALADLLGAVGLSRSSYFYQRSRLQVADKYADVRQAMADIFECNYRCYGYRRMRAALSDQAVILSEKVVRRLMKQECLVATKSKRRRYGSYLGEISPAPDNLLNRDFSAGAPNEKWLTDITEFQIPAGKVYLSPMIDCFDGMVVSWSIGTRPNADLVNTMLDAAIDKASISPERPIVHSDRGAHYRWPGWLSRIADAKLIRSMSRKGCSPDNAACEGFFGRLKIEMFFARDWLSTTVEEFVVALDAYIRWYNGTRIKVSLGGLSPVAYRRSLGIAV